MTYWPPLTGYLPGSPVTVFSRRPSPTEAALACAQAGRRLTRGHSGPKRARCLAGRFLAVVRSGHGVVYRCAHLTFCNLGGRP
jgi:hypothetical protein